MVQTWRDPEWSAAIGAAQSRYWQRMTPRERAAEFARRVGTVRHGSPGWTDRRQYDDAGVEALRDAGRKRGAVLHEMREQRAQEAHALASAGMTPAAVAAHLGLSRVTVWRYLAQRVDCWIG
jgi:hypothetical protein